MSRIIVKNLHSNVTEKKLKEKFAEKGVITDIQLKYTKDGKFRHFGFVGYQTNEEAEAAVEYFDKSFFNSQRISVQLCSELGDKSKPQAWSKYAPDSSAFKKLQKVEKKPDIKSKSLEIDPITKHLNKKIEKLKDDPDFLEFLEVHKKDRTVWGNDDITAFLSLKKKNLNKVSAEKSESEDEAEVEESKIAEDRTISDAEYLQLKAGKKTLDQVEKIEHPVEYFTLIVRGLPCTVRKQDIKRFFKPLKVDSIRVPRQIKGIAYVGFKKESRMKKALRRNKSFVEGKQISIWRMDTQTENDNSPNTHKNEKWKEQENGLKSVEAVAESGRIFCRNLQYDVTEEEIQTHFEKYGPVSEVILPVDNLIRVNRGYAIVTFLIPEHAVKAFTELDGTIFHGRMFHLVPGKPKEDDKIGSHEGSSFKNKKVQKLKEEAGSSHNWNTLFMGSNAVADITSNNYSVSKEKVLSGSNAAVRVALGETQLVNETKEFLVENGVKLDAFNRATNHRSKTVILAKNLPSGSTIKQVRKIFKKQGRLGRTLLPPNGTTAIVEFVEPSEARTAFRELAYSKFKDVTLFLEWAPDDIFVQNVPEDEKGSHEGRSFKNRKVLDWEEEAGSNVVDDITSNNYRVSNKKVSSGSNEAGWFSLRETQLDNETKEFLVENGVKLDALNKVTNQRSKTVILVKNIPPGTYFKKVRKIFSKHGRLVRTLLPPNGTTAIVEFVEPSEARTAFRELAFSNFRDVATLFLEWAPDDIFVQNVPEDEKVPTINEAPQVVAEEEKDDPEDDTTLFIKNLNFDTTEDRIKEHFKNCGKIAYVSVARKKDSQKSDALLSRGFGFIQFYRKNSTNIALKTLQKSMLDGHSIELSRSNRTLKTDSHLARKENNVEKQTGTKILVRNIPFQAKYYELQELFKAFGDIKSLRLPKKMLGPETHRGFAFVEYHSKQDAKRAMQSLCQSTHLYGRRLVLEWAQSAEEDIDQIRKRAAERFYTDEPVKSKKSTADILGTEHSDDE